LKIVNLDISYYLTLIHNLNYLNAYIPTYFKSVLIYPLHKKDSKHNYKNYRPIATLNSISKIFEKISSKRIINYIESNNILSNNQVGYQKTLNSQTAIIKKRDYISKNLSNGHSTLGIYLDISRVFESVNHDILIIKLEKYNFKDLVLKWIANYLTDRTQVTIVNNTKSNVCKLTLRLP
jgi:hypothetical protein